jgi:hypothetical protein
MQCRCAGPGKDGGIPSGLEGGRSLQVLAAVDVCVCVCECRHFDIRGDLTLCLIPAPCPKKATVDLGVGGAGVCVWPLAGPALTEVQ